MQRAVIGFVLALALFVPSATMHLANATLDPHALALDITAFPAGAVLLHQHVDTTAAEVNAEGITGSPDTQGNIYTQLHFEASLIEKVRLPSFNTVGRAVWLIATIFPSVTDAQEAFLQDTRFDQCDVRCPESTLSVRGKPRRWAPTRTNSIRRSPARPGRDPF